MIYVLTAIAGGFDNLRPPLTNRYDPDARYICFTDNPLQAACQPWEFRPLPDLGHPGRSTRAPKILPHLFLPPDAEYSIWHDANFQLQIEPAKIVEGLRGESEVWGAHKHPGRDCIYDEAGILLRENIGTPALVEREIARYRQMEHPEHYGLWANGFIVRKHGPLARSISETWWRLYQAGCERDQLSFPVAVRMHSAFTNILTTEQSVYKSPFVKFNWHAPWLDKEDNPSHHEARRIMGDRLRELRKATGITVRYWGESE